MYILYMNPTMNAYHQHKLHKNDPATMAAYAEWSEHLTVCPKCYSTSRGDRRCDTGYLLERAYNRAFNTAR
jgi:hypothetical protein